MINSNAALTSLHGVGEKTAKLFESRGIKTVGELLSYYPKGYDWFDETVTVDRLQAGQIAAVRLLITGNGSTVQAGSYKITTFRAADATGWLRLTFFNMPYLQKTLQRGSIHVFRGRVRQYQNGKMELSQPAVFTPSEYDEIQTRFLPRYPLFHGVKNPQLIRIMKTALENYAFAEDYLPDEDRRRLGLYTEQEATQNIHFPSDKEALVSARNRKVFDEFLQFILTIRKEKTVRETLINNRPMLPVAQTQRLIEQLPYKLTGDQQKAWSQIESDLCGKTVMNRLLEGDVGSGKTILAFLALLLCACNGRQGALMAPTEVLAQQHMKNLEELIKRYQLPIHPVLLTGSVKGKTRKAAYAAISSGEANVIIGTHALIQEAVTYHDLSLVITDEQHRFGVRQREAFAGKGDMIPVLVMSATPIPRTLALILYGDLSISQLRELPGNRLRIKNLAIDTSARPRVYRFLYHQIQEGRQAYVICPAIGDGQEEEEDVAEETKASWPAANSFLQEEKAGQAMDLITMENVLDYTQKLRQIFPPEVRIEMLHGKMKPAEKDRIMTAFANHDIDILVSTTVIEVGIDVANASTILIENAEHFGLSQLHQLRGRVGRGTWQSYCIFMYPASIQEKPRRLAILEKSNDGFAIAEEDLKLRGPGDMFGTRQSGDFGFQLADIYEDAGIMQQAAAYADEIIARHKEIHLPDEMHVDFRSI